MVKLDGNTGADEKSHARMDLKKVNRFGLVYAIEGTDKSLRPLMLTAHQDVVPDADESTWTHPPFSAYFDGTWLWGRGASDDKNSLTALMSAGGDSAVQS